MREQRYSALHRSWPVEELAELADGPTGRGEVARGGCSFAWNLCHKVTCTDRGGEKGWVKHGAVAALVTRSNGNFTGQQLCTALYNSLILTCVGVLAAEWVT